MSDTPDPKPNPEALSPSEALNLLHALRDRLVEAVANEYAGHLQDAKRDMQHLAQRASESARRELYASGHALLANGGLALLRRFREVFCRACDQAIASLTGQEDDAWSVAGELSLVDANAFERDLAVGRLSAKAGYACSQQLTALDRRVAALLELKRLEGDSNPLAVKRLFAAFVDAAEANWAGEQLSLILLETFEHYTADRLPDIYRELNQFLVDNGVLVKLPVEIEARERELERGGGGGGGGDAVGDVFVQLASGLMGDTGHGGFGGGGAGGVGLGGGGAGGMAAAGAAEGNEPLRGQMAPMVLTQLIDGLTGLQRGNGQAAAKLGIDLGAVDTESSAMLRSLGASPLLRWLQPNDALTIELVAMLFDCIFSDVEVPPQLRTEIGKLQVPVLKVALMNKGFFSDHRHPARRLIDVMAAAVRGWSKGDEDALLERIRSAVDKVLAGFENDTGVFNKQVEQIEAELKEAERAARGRVSGLVQRLEQRDRQLVAETMVADRIARCRAGVELPPPVAEFIDQHWHELLARIYVKYGDAGEGWQDALTTLEDLIWSVQPKANPEERHRLMQMLPQLLQRLPAGLARIGRDAAWEPFLADLMRLHMEAVKQDAAPSAAAEVGAAAGEQSSAAVQGAAQPDTDSLPWMLDSESDEAADEGVGGEGENAPGAEQEIPAPACAEAMVAPSSELARGLAAEPAAESADAEPAEADAEAVEQDTYLAAARQVDLGDWLEVQRLDGTNLSLRASWRSRQSGLILFADRRGRNAQVLTAQRLAAALRQGSARLLSRDPLTDRAVAQLLVKSAPQEASIA